MATMSDTWTIGAFEGCFSQVETGDIMSHIEHLSIKKNLEGELYDLVKKCTHFGRMM